MSDDIKSLSYEAAFEQLEAVTARLEGGALSLEESVALYERGRQLASRCQNLLEAAELKIRQVDDIHGEAGP